MAITTSKKQVFWATAAIKSVAFGANALSDAITSFTQADFQMKVVIQADNDGTAQANDIMEFWLNESHGDPGVDPDVLALFDTAEQGRFLGFIDTNEDEPGRKTVWVPGPFDEAKVYMKNISAGRAITGAVQFNVQAG